MRDARSSGTRTLTNKCTPLPLKFNGFVTSTPSEVSPGPAAARGTAAREAKPSRRRMVEEVYARTEGSGAPSRERVTPCSCSFNMGLQLEN